MYWIREGNEKEEVAVKIISLKNDKNYKRAIEIFKHELSIWSKINSHKNIL